MDYQVTSIEDTELQPDKYARVNNLSADSRVDLSLLFVYFRSQNNQPPLDESIDDVFLPQLHIPYLIPRTEQLNVSKESLELLSHVSSLGLERNKTIWQQTDETLTSLKLEPPLLRTDPEYDCRELARSVAEWRRANVDLASVPLERLNTANDESLEFPETSHKFKQMLVETIQDEKVDILKEGLIYLSRVLKDEWTEEKQQVLLDEASSGRMRLQDLALTPPLSPLSQEEGYFIPDEIACQVPMSSDPSTLFDHDLPKAEADLLREDTCHPEIPSSPESGPLVALLSNDLPLIELKRQKIDSLKIEGPLTPLNPSITSSSPLIDASNLKKTMDIDQVLDEQHMDLFDARGNEDPDGIFSDDIMSTLKSQASAVKRNIEQEQLQTADAIARITIPAMDFSISSPDWQLTSLDPASQLAWIETTYECFNIPLWARDSQVERELRWSPFPAKMGYVSMNEMFDEGDDIAKALLDFTGPPEISTSTDYVWKQPGLAILRELEDEEEQLDSPLVRSGEISIDLLVKKRKLEFSTSGPDTDDLADSASPVDLLQFSRSPPAMESRESPPKQLQLPNLLLGCDDPSATSTLLSNYVDFHMAKRQKSTKSTFFVSSTKPMDQVEVKARAETAIVGRPEVSHASKAALAQKLAAPAPCPTLGQTPEATKIIKALTLERGIFSRLEKSYPDAEIIERDFERWDVLTWNRNSVSRSPVASPLAAEADVIVSPATGIIVTTLLQAIQRPIPGTGGPSKTRQRIRDVALRYERLIVLVSEANRIDETARDLTHGECTGYAEFAGFVSELDTHTQVYYVGGGSDTLVKWLVSFLIRYAPEAADMQGILIQEESLWELFLRRAGLNAYAAQAILGQLKAPDDVPEGDAGKYGLPAFIKMSPADRLLAFRGLMGGEKVLCRVNKILEMQWV